MESCNVIWWFVFCWLLWQYLEQCRRSINQFSRFFFLTSWISPPKLVPERIDSETDFEQEHTPKSQVNITKPTQSQISSQYHQINSSEFYFFLVDNYVRTCFILALPYVYSVYKIHHKISITSIVESIINLPL